MSKPCASAAVYAGGMTGPTTDPNKLGEISNAERSLAALTREGTTERVKPFGIQWPAVWWLKWATIHHAFRTLEIPDGAAVLDVGSGTGWATLLLAEAGYRATGVDIAPGNVEIGRLHARRWNSPAEFTTADMDTLDLGRSFDAVLMFDALHHVDDPAAVVRRVGQHLKPGGWALFGEPSLLHLLSPNARSVSRDLGWIENGISVRSLRRWCRGAGMPETRRFFEPTRPYSDRVRQFGWEAVRLVAANAAFAPTYHVWLAARRTQAGSGVPAG
jgi:SAM-dependent methyltransferase